MGKGFYVTVMVGPAVPIPLSRDVLESLESIKVTVGERGVFEMVFKLSKDSPLHTIFLLSGGGSIPPIMRVVIVVTINGTADVIMDGVITDHQMARSSDGGDAKLVVTGEDLSAVMNLIDFSGFPFPAMPYSVRVLTILAKYAFLGVIPMVIPSVLVDVPIPTDRIPRQQGKDREYIKALAEEVGYVFYIDPGPAPGTSKAYWGPEIKVGAPQPALNLDMDHLTNVEAINFRFDNQKKTLPVLMIQNKETKVPIPIPVPDVTPLSPPLGAVPPIPQRIDFITGTAKQSPLQAAMIGLAKAAKSSDAVFANGSLDVTRYGRVLKSRKLVGVRGAGLAFNGLYYVKSVTHNIKRGEYKQSFELTRNGLISTLPKVAT